MKPALKAIAVLVVATPLATLAAVGDPMTGDPVAGKAIFDHICHACHAALPYTGRVGAANLPAFLANPRRYNPKTAMTFPGLRSKKDIADVIAFITAGH
jgi:cytochrome c2